jgi:phosphate transport system permease protein
MGTLLILFLIGLFLLLQGLPAFRYMGLGFFTTTGFLTFGAHPRFGVLALATGTIIIATVAIVIAVPVAVAAALFISEYAPRRMRKPLTSLVDLMAAVPSVIFGLWGFFQVQPAVVGFARWLSQHLGFIPIFHVSTALFTSSSLMAGIVVAIMVMPIVASIAREVFSLAPQAEREGALALGASRWRMIRAVVIPFGRGGLVGATMLGLGRALGETIAVSIIISPIYSVQPHILQQGTNSIAAQIALDFGSGGKLGLHALLAAGLVLFAMTLVVNLIASAIVNRSRSAKGVEL